MKLAYRNGTEEDTHALQALRILTYGQHPFVYRQVGNIHTSEYAGGMVRTSHLLGLVDENGNIDMRYHQVNQQGELITGICHSEPEILQNGKIQLHECWQWTSGDGSTGESIIEEK